MRRSIVRSLIAQYLGQLLLCNDSRHLCVGIRVPESWNGFICALLCANYEPFPPVAVVGIVSDVGHHPSFVAPLFVPYTGETCYTECKILDSGHEFSFNA